MAALTGIDSRTIWRIFLRTYLVGACFNTRGMQNIGLGLAMDPGLRALHSDPAELGRARRRALKHYNSHPFFAPMLAGVFLSLEAAIARGEIKPKTLEEVKRTASYTLSAIGDSFFGGGLVPFWALSTVCLVASSNHAAAVVWGAGLVVALQWFRFMGLVTGVRHGLGALPRLKRLNLINWGRRLKYANGLLIILLWAMLWRGEMVWWKWLLSCSLLGAAAWLVRRLGLPREVVVLGLVAGYVLWPWMARMV
ncbi:PTS system mannose/fructose/sorbose family transporter subunit IID [Desulfohalovibrio reitneri]|uniref:PTS system mannose/fructose/sorbose family transporter subunit IID n=1 Tax=Desulfohalovibrio reitneri TaxID=1307759 RepID=UPI000554DEA9|nr:PTS system mannose/fructose/sorbose family transporter subunit IID [Desulfohalovibrio reitneri]